MISILLLAGLSLMAQDTPQIRVLLHANVINAIDNEVHSNSTLIIEGDHIKQIYYGSEGTIPSGAITYDLSGNYVIPGLIDGHVHFGTDPSGSDAEELTKRRLAFFLHSGITAVRDMAGDTRFLGFMSREAALGEITSPDIYYSSLMAAPSFFDDPRTHASANGAVAGQTSWMKAVTKDTDFKVAVAEAKGTGATGIKIYADLTADLIAKITEQAKLQHMKVWSHAAVFPAKPMEVVKAGVDVVSHSTLLAWEGVDYLPSSAKGRYIEQKDFDVNKPVFEKLMVEMKKRNTLLDATVATYKNERFETTIYPQGIALTKLAYKHGIKIGAGTDMGLRENAKEAPLFIEMELLVNEVGMTPMDVIKAATIINAEIIGVEKKIGSLEAGKQADLVVLRSNPLDNIRNTTDIRFVFKKGNIVE